MKRNQGFKSLIIVQRIECGETLLQNLILISSGRGADEVEDLRSDILRKASHRVLELGLGYSDGFDGKLRISLRKPYFSCFGPENWEFKSNVRSYNRN